MSCKTLLHEKVALTTRNDTKLHDRGQEIWKRCGARLKSAIESEALNFILEGGGQVSVNPDSASTTLLLRDYPEIAFFDGESKIRLICVPEEIIPQFPFLEPHRVDQTKQFVQEAKAGQGPEFQRQAAQTAAEKLETWERHEEGEAPEMLAHAAIKIVFKDSFATLVIYSLKMFRVEGNGFDEFDFLVLDFATATIYSIEVKKTLSNRSIKTALKQLQKAFDYLSHWFGADIKKKWNFQPVIFGSEVKDSYQCENCNVIVAEGQDEFIVKLSQHVKDNQVPKKEHKGLIEDFQLMSRYLLFALGVKLLPTTARHLPEFSKYMEKVGSWESILVWCIFTPGQTELLSKRRVVFFSGWGGGKTIVATEACKNWAQRQKVLIVVNGFNTLDQTMLLVYSLKLNLQRFKHIEVQQIDIDKDPIEHLMKVVQGHACVFLDEMPGDTETVKSSSFKMKFKALTDGKTLVWVALSNFDKFDIKGKTSTVILKKNEIETTFPDYEVVTSLKKNMRNPVHIKEKVKESDKKKEGFRDVVTTTASQLFGQMESPTNLVSGITEDHHSTLKRVFIDKNMKAVITSSSPEDAHVLHQLLKFGFKRSTLALTPWRNSENVEKEVCKWLRWNQTMEGIPNIIVTFNKIIYGFDVEIVISIDDVDDKYLGDVASRATNQFIVWRDFHSFLIVSKSLPMREECFEMYRKIHNKDCLLKLIFERLQESCQISKDDFAKTLQKPAKKYPSGIMEILFKASVHFNLCFKLVAFDSKSGQMKTLNLCSGAHHVRATTCSSTLQLACSASPNFLLMMRDKDVSGQNSLLESPDLSWCLFQMRSQHYGYTIHPRINQNELLVIVNNGQTFIEAIKENTSNSLFVYFFPLHGDNKSFCKTLHKHLTSVELDEKQIFCRENELQDFLKTKIGTNSLLLIDLSYEKGLYQNMPSECHLFTTYFKCPLDPYSGEGKIIKILGANPNLYGKSFGGKGHIQDDPLNIVTIFDHLLSKHGYKVRSKFFPLVFGGNSSFEDSFNLGIIPMFDELGYIDESNKAELKDDFRQFERFLLKPTMTFRERKPTVTQMFQTVCRQSHDLYALKIDQLKLAPVYLVKPRKSLLAWITGSGSDSESATANILFMYDEFFAHNGFLVLDKIESSHQPSIMSALFKNPFSNMPMPRLANGLLKITLCACVCFGLCKAVCSGRKLFR